MENQCVGDCQIAIETKKKAEEMTAKLKREKEKNSSMAVQLEEAMMQISKLEKSLSEKAHVEEERKLVDKQLKELQKKLTELEMEMTASQKNLQEAKEQVKHFHFIIFFLVVSKKNHMQHFAFLRMIKDG